MTRKLKFVLVSSIMLIAGTTGLAIAKKNGDHHDRGALKQKFDANKDGVLDDAERAKMKAAMGDLREKRKTERVAKFDSNKDGSLDDSERAAMKAEHAEARFKRLDANGDGMLSKDEFAKANHGRRGGMHKRH